MARALSELGSLANTDSVIYVYGTVMNIALLGSVTQSEQI